MAWCSETLLTHSIEDGEVFRRWFLRGYWVHPYWRRRKTTLVEKGLGEHLVIDPVQDQVLTLDPTLRVVDLIEEQRSLGLPKHGRRWPASNQTMGIYLCVTPCVVSRLFTLLYFTLCCWIRRVEQLGFVILGSKVEICLADDMACWCGQPNVCYWMMTCIP
jgi:hypothetical protein